MDMESIIATDELAGCCSRLFAAEAECWIMEASRLRHRKDLIENIGYIDFIETWTEDGGPSMATYWRQLIRLCGSRKKAHSTYIAYVNLLGEVGL